MSRFDIKGLVEKHTNDGEVDYEAVNKVITEQSNGINAKTESKFKIEAENAGNLALQGFLKENNFKDTAEFKAFVKNGATADSERFNELQADFDKYKVTAEEHQSKYDDVNEKYKKSRIENQITDTSKAGYVLYEIGKLQTDDVSFDDATTQFLKDNPEYGKNGANTPRVKHSGNNSQEFMNAVEESNARKVMGLPPKN